jgi:hypothetical protein
MDNIQYNKTVKAFQFQIDSSKLKISEATKNYNCAVERAQHKDEARLNQINLKAQFEANIANLHLEESRHKASLITFQSLHKPIDKNTFLKIKQALLDEKLDLITSLHKHEIEDIEVCLSPQYGGLGLVSLLQKRNPFMKPQQDPVHIRSPPFQICVIALKVIIVGQNVIKTFNQKGIIRSTDRNQMPLA